MIEIAEPNSFSSVADWIELRLSSKGNVISKTVVAAQIEKDGGTEPEESFLSDIWTELMRRQAFYYTKFFTVEERSVESSFDASTKPEYSFCLLLSLYGNPTDTLKAAKLFEKVSSAAMKNYLCGEGIVFGFPRPDPDENSIKQGIMKAANETNERFVEAPSEKYKDRGVDIIGWKPFFDKRSSQVVVLLQCAAGHNWRDKAITLPLPSWTQYIHWAHDPITGFSVPCVIPDQEWHEVSRDAGVLFDRIRILNLLPDGITDATLRGELASWVTTRMQELDT